MGGTSIVVDLEENYLARNVTWFTEVPSNDTTRQNVQSKDRKRNLQWPFVSRDFNTTWNTQCMIARKDRHEETQVMVTHV